LPDQGWSAVTFLHLRRNVDKKIARLCALFFCRVEGVRWAHLSNYYYESETIASNSSVTPSIDSGIDRGWTN
jgi:hypothetical protein